MKYFLTWLMVAGISSLNYAQVAINLQLPPAGLSVKDQLWNLSLVNSGGQPLLVQLEMQLSDASTNQRVLTAVTREFLLPKGVKQIRSADIMPITYNVVNPSYPVDASPNGLLPVGVFNICFTATAGATHGERLSDECETIEVEPLSPPTLMLPADQEVVEYSRPQFSWIPPAPVNLFNRLSYDLVLVEVLPTQSPADAIVQNIPVLLLPNIGFNSVQFPHSVRELDTAKTYAWRIKANNNGLPIANSETWIFKIAKPNSDKNSAVKRYDYTKLSRTEDAAFSSCDGQLYFQYTHNLNDTAVSIKIFDVSKAKKIPVPLDDKQMTVRYGVNFQTLNLDDHAALINQHMYLMELTNASEEKWYLKFRFSKP